MNTPNVPMRPNELPQQRLYEVKGIPPQPADFEVQLLNYEQRHSFDRIPQKPTKKSLYVCQVEWAWSPMNNRIDAYYIHKGRTHWLLWMGHHNDEDWFNWRWEWYPATAMPVKGVSVEQAAGYLLMEQWRREVERHDIDRYHWINEEGQLTVSELQAIANVIWPEEDN